MAKHVYIPIVKGKLNDLRSLGRLVPEIRSLIKPLIELPPVSIKTKNVDDHLDKFMAHLKDSKEQGPAFVDFYGFFPGEKDSSGMPAPVAGYMRLAAENRLVTPVYGFGRDEKVWVHLPAVVAEHKRGFCFRLEEDDLESDVVEETWDSIVSRAAELALPMNQIDLVLDLRDVRVKSVDERVALVTDFLLEMPEGMGFRTVAVAGSSAPKDVSVVKADALGVIERNELKIWARLAADLAMGTNLCYSDYGIVHPDFAADDMPVGGTANCKIRYTTDNNILVFRGHKRAGDSGQPFELARQVCAHSAYCGSGFSFGDEYIERVADPDDSTGPGNLGNWVLADMNHHLAFATRQMEQLLASIESAETEEEVEEIWEAVI